MGLNNHNQLKKPSISSEAKTQQIRSWESFCKTQAFFSWKPIPCWKEAFICSVYCHYTINKCHKKQLQPRAWGLLTLSPSGRLALHAALLPGTSFWGLCHWLLFKGKWHLSAPDPGRLRDTHGDTNFLQLSFSSSKRIPVYPLDLRSGLQIFVAHFFCNAVNWVSVFHNLPIHPSCFPHWELIIQGGNGGQKEGGREKGKKTVPAKQICCYWVRRIASKGWLTVPSDIVFLISKGKWPSTHLPTGKKCNGSWDCRYRELNVQIHTLAFCTFAPAIISGRFPSRSTSRLS